MMACIFLLLCMSVNFLFGARYWEFFLVVFFYLCIPIIVLELCLEMLLICLETIGSF